MPGATRRALLLAAAAERFDPDGAPVGLLRAAGAGPFCLLPAERAGVIRVADGRIRFTGAAVRAEAYEGRPFAHRALAHAALAAVLGDDPRRFLHRAVAAPAPALGDALAAAAPTLPGALRVEAYALAAGLATTPGVRRGRLLTAAEHAWRGGDPGRARGLLREAESAAEGCGGGDGGRGVLGEVCGGDYGRGLLGEGESAAEACGGGDDDGRGLLREACGGDDGRALLLRGVVETRAGSAEDGLRLLVRAAGTGGGSPTAWVYAAEAAWAVGDAGAWRTAVRRAGLTGAGGHADPARLAHATVHAQLRGDPAIARDLARRMLDAVREAADRAGEPRALELLAGAELRLGHFRTAARHAREGLRLAERTGQPALAARHHALLALAAATTGDAPATARHAHAAGPHGQGAAATLATWALARAELLTGHADAAAARLVPLVLPGPYEGHFALRTLALPCCAEAAALCGETDAARAAVAAYERHAVHDPRAAARLLRCRALIAPDPAAARPLFERALALHDAQGPGAGFERARTQLLFGRTLHRARRPCEARHQLRAALLAFERCGAGGWATRARAELRATGGATDRADPGQLGRLTPQQARIARQVAEGSTNREIARSLSVSPRTVDHHLRNAFALLGVRSRVELARLVHDADTDA
ncbi:hypothetical protein SRB5_60500 [Streptomyces sp. RB5]|uniref:HTH luxR-type domain-containing protein n=1 Tax=Streptomyces smaragdinus TaxID=2585196 RepID=A0A7K0CQX1_9ACTN|nr:hypothetical protein [Streptomyces smaragdinus]